MSMGRVAFGASVLCQASMKSDDAGKSNLEDRLLRMPSTAVRTSKVFQGWG